MSSLVVVELHNVLFITVIEVDLRGVPCTVFELIYEVLHIQISGGNLSPL